MKQIIIGACVALFASAESMYNPVKSEVQILNNKNYAKQVTQNREKGISIVQYYIAGDSASTSHKGQYEKFAIENKGMFRICSVECNEFVDICNQEDIKSYPAYKVFPPMPVPAFEVKQETSDLETDTLKKAAYKFVGNRVIEVNQNNIKTFINDNPGKPKMLLFTETKSAPMVVRALSTYFDKTLEFGMIKKDETALAQEYKVTKYPTFILLKGKEKIYYKDTEFTYHKLFEFINIYSETFVFVGDNENAEVKSAATKQWLNVATPYLTKDSANDICLKKEATLCVIYVSPNQEKTKEVDATFDKVKQAFVSKIERGIQFVFVRLDSELEAAWGELLRGDSAPSREPYAVVLNPGKRKKFMKVEGNPLSVEVIQDHLDKILGGDARFKAVKGNELPALVSSYEAYITN